MSKHHQKGGKPLQLENPYYLTPIQPVRRHAKTYRPREGSAIYRVERDTTAHTPRERQGRIIRPDIVDWAGLFLGIIALILITEHKLSSPECNVNTIDCNLTKDYLLLVGIFAISEYALRLSQKPYHSQAHKNQRRSRKNYHQSISIPHALIRTYTGIFAFYIFILLALRQDLSSPTTQIIALGIGLHVLSVILRCFLLALLAVREELYFDHESSSPITFGIWLRNLPLFVRYFIMRFLDQLMPNQHEDRYALSEDGEIDYFIAGDDDTQYVLGSDGEIEKVKRGQ